MTTPPPPVVNGSDMHALMARLFPVNRSLTGDGVRLTLRVIGEHLPGLTLHEVASGTRALDWLVPDEWNVRDAYIQNGAGQRVVDFQAHTLHLVGYSEPVDRLMSLEELQSHLFSLPDQLDAIPYVTSYYRRFWGFCLSHRQRQALTEQNYRVVIDATLAPGYLTYADLRIPGRSKQEIFISSYVCHPSMANNELSGPALLTALGQWLAGRDNRYSYRLVLAPESIGPIVYMSQHLEEMKRRTIAAFNLTCVGDERAVSLMPSRQGNTLTDRAARHVLRHMAPEHRVYDFYQDRGSDERQYCSPGADLPMVSIMRSRYGDYPEYHTSLDDLTVATPAGLQRSLELHQAAIETIERNETLCAGIVGEPHLARRGMDFNLGGGVGVAAARKQAQDLMAWSDGSRDLIDTADAMGMSLLELLPVVDLLKQQELLIPCAHSE
ncbi:DUF4910 domain-containing protein [Magnetofaba australis]|nr:DUF4910 domain-containing protein [Magnetofaba australis]